MQDSCPTCGRSGGRLAANSGSFLLRRMLSLIGFVDGRDSVWMKSGIGSKMED